MRKGKFGKTLLALSMVATLAAPLYPVKATEGGTDFTEMMNYALEGTASASASPISYWGPDKLNDGIINRDADKPDQSRWSSEAGAPGWAKIDLNEERTFKELLLAFENDKVRSFHVDVSNDDSEYTTIYTSEDKTEGHDKDTTVTLEEAVTARYVKVTVDSLISGAYPSVSMYEIGIYGEEEYLNFADEATAEASDSEIASFSGENTNDNDLETRWASNYEHGDKTLTYTFEEAKELKSMILRWERCNAKAFQIQVDDNGEWKTVYTGTQPTSFVQKINLTESYTTTKVRLVINDFFDDSPLEDGSPMNYPTVSLYEVQMYDRELVIEPEDVVTVDDIAANITSAELSEDGSKLIMPTVPTGYEISFVGADYEQILARDMTVSKPLTTQDVELNFEVTETKTGEKAISPAINVTIPGIYDEETSQNAKPKVIPELQQWYGETGVFEINDNSRIVVDPAVSQFEGTANKFAADYLDILDKNIPVVIGTDPKAGDFYFTTSEETLDKETYVLDIDNYVTIKATENTGAYWATRTILQVLKQTGNQIPKGITKDYPKYEVRGFMLDVARKSFQMDFLEELVKTMSWYKLNNFHVHLNDNCFGKLEDGKTPDYSAFRLESDIPNLTNTDLYYTKDEFRSFILNSREVGVDIVPEFDSPGHSGAFVRARPDLARADSNEYLDVENPEALEFIKSVFAEYTSGDNPVFPKGTVIQIGTDEYKRGNKEAFRKYQDELLKFIRDEQGYTPRVWGSQTENEGTTPITVDGVQMNLWYVGYANPREMYEKGYKCINSNDGDLYIVPGAGYYYDYLNQSHIHSTWQPNKIGNFTIPVGDDQMLGSTFHVWNDKTGPSNDNGTTDVEVFDRIFHILPTFSAKLWGDINDYSVDDLNKLTEKIKYAPNSNPTYEIETEGSKVLDYNFNNDRGLDKSGNEFNMVAQENISYEEGKNRNALSLKGGASYVETPLEDLGLNSYLEFWVKRDSNSGTDEQILFESENGAIKAVQKDTGKLGFTREGRDYSFNYELPKDEWVKIKLETKFTRTLLYVNDEFVDELSISATGGKWATLIIPLERIGSKTNAFIGEIDDVQVSKEEITTKAYATSEQSQDKASNAIDGNPDTMWHTKWDGSDELPQSITLELAKAREIKGYNYLPRQSGTNGYITKYKIEVSTDGEEFTEVAAGDWARDAELKTVEFDSVNAKYIRLTALEGVGGFASAAEVSPIYTTEEVILNTRALSESMEVAEIILEDSSSYTPESVAALKEALEEAREVLMSATDQGTVDEMTAKLDAVIEAMEEAEVVEADKTALKIAIDLANAITDEDLADVVKAVADEFIAARDEANTIYNDASATQEQVNNAFDRLASVMHMLDFVKGDKTALKAFIDKVSGLEADKYTTDIWAAFDKELDEAKAVYADDNAMQEEVNTAYNELVTAFLNLRLIPDKSLLEELINQASGLDSANYTKASFDGLTKALNEAKVVFENPNATQVEVDSAKATLEKAIAGLQANPSTPSNVDSTVKTPVNSGDTTSVKTGDDALVGTLAGLALLSIAGAKVLRKKED